MTEITGNPIASSPRRPGFVLPILLAIFLLFFATGTRAQGKEWATYRVYDIVERSWLGDVDWATKWYFDRHALTNLVPLYAYDSEVACTGSDLSTVMERLKDQKLNPKLAFLAMYAAAIAGGPTDRKPDPKLASLAKKYAAKGHPLQLADEELLPAAVRLLSAAIAGGPTDRKPDPKLASLAKKYAAKGHPLQLADEELLPAAVRLLSAAIAGGPTDRKPDPKLASLAKKYAAKGHPLQLADEELLPAAVRLLSAAIAGGPTDRKPDPKLASFVKYPSAKVDTPTLRRITSGRRDSAAHSEPRRTAMVHRDPNGGSDAPWVARFGSLSTLCHVLAEMPSKRSMFIATDYVFPDTQFERLFYLDRTDTPFKSP